MSLVPYPPLNLVLPPIGVDAHLQYSAIKKKHMLFTS